MDALSAGGVGGEQAARVRGAPGAQRLGLPRRVAPGPQARRRRGLPRSLSLPVTMYVLNSFTKSTPPKNRQLNILICNSKQRVEDFVGELTF